MDKHVTAVAAIFIAFGSLGVFFALVILVAIVGGGLASGDGEAMFITSIVGPAIAGPFLLFEGAKVVAGIALLQRRRWARILVLVLSFLSLILIPIGTAYGIYAIWVLMNDETVRLLEAADAQ
jgi:hypothetical protein